MLSWPWEGRPMATSGNGKMSRRRFLKVTAAGALGFSAVGPGRSMAAAAGGETKKPAGKPAGLPVRGFHTEVLERGDVSLREKFIRDALPREGVNVLVLEIGYYYAFQSY